MRWGIIGTGSIARRFAEDAAVTRGNQIVAAASRRSPLAKRFAAEFSVAHTYADYRDLVHDPDVDVIYVATPTTHHYAAAMAALTAGKHVLVEKPFALNAAESAHMIQTARRADVFLMEAMWTRFLPHFAELRRVLAAGSLGPVDGVSSDLGYAAHVDPQSRLLNPALGGGALLDLGVYAVSASLMILGAVTQVQAQSRLMDSGVDGRTDVLLTHQNGGSSLFRVSLQTSSTGLLSILGSTGRAEAGPVWILPSRLRTYGPDDSLMADFDGAGAKNGLRYEIDEVCRCIAGGQTESPVMPLRESQAVMETLDAIRSAIGLTYPGEPDPF